ncbi:hypothetical protein L208DRAFT_654182 [Tricholoma matsutake]|nr:hypothetical protein L208DRAFT_654182 [Tricholoma matsutake 945]
MSHNYRYEETVTTSDDSPPDLDIMILSITPRDQGYKDRTHDYQGPLLATENMPKTLNFDVDEPPKTFTQGPGRNEPPESSSTTQCMTRINDMTLTCCSLTTAHDNPASARRSFSGIVKPGQLCLFFSISFV